MKRTMFLLFVSLATLAGCTGVHSSGDAGPSADASSLPSCIQYVNILQVHAMECGWQSWTCLPGRPGTARLEECRVAIDAVSLDCAAIEDLVVSPSCAP